MWLQVIAEVVMIFQFIAGLKKALWQVASVFVCVCVCNCLRDLRLLFACVCECVCV